MELTVLGSGGNSPVPMPTCTCGICREARERGAPYARNGNSLYLPGLGAMIDAPEQTLHNLNREGVTDLDYVFLTHWHPDHVSGVRVVQSRDFMEFDPAAEGKRAFYRRTAPTVVTTRAVYERTCDITGLDHYVDVGFADLHLLDENGPLRDRGFEVRSVPYALTGDEVDATGFVVERDGSRLAVVSDDATYLDESLLPDAIGLTVFECGIFERGPDGERLFDDDYVDVLEHEPRHDDILDRIDRVQPDRALLTEISHTFARSFDDYRALESRPRYDGVRFAHDGLTASI